MTQLTASSGTTWLVHPLVERITRMRGRVRAVVGLFGLGVLVTAGISGIVALMGMDYLVHINSPAARVVLLITWFAVLAVLAWRVLIHPLSTRLTDQFLASRVENIHKDLEDELISAVHFIHAGTIRTNALAARHVDAAAKKTASIRFEEAVDFQRSSKALLVAAFVVMVAAVLFGVNPNLGRIALSRWFSGNAMDWPRTTQVMFAWGTPGNQPPAVLPVGEEVVLRAKVVKGGYASQRVWLTTWGENESSQSDLMTYQQAMSNEKEFVYERTLEPKGEKLFSAKLEAGDDTEQSAVNIRLAPRPVISELAAMIAPPAYVRDLKDPTKPAAAVAWDMMTQKARAVEGAAVTLQVRASKPFQLDSQGLPVVTLWAQSKDVEVAPGTVRKLVDPNVAELRFTAVQSWDARVVMKDTDGFENHAGGTVSLLVVPDALPSVVITEPRRMATRSPKASLEVAVQGTDDLGLDGVKLVAEKFDAKPGEVPVFEQALTWAERTMDPASGNTTGKATYTWNLEPLQLPPGARLTFYAMVQDNYEVNGKRHDWVKSAPLTLQILTEEQVAAILREELIAVKGRIIALTLAQENTRDRTDVIQKAAASSGITTPQQKDMLANLAQQQSQEAAQANAIQQKVEQIKNDLAQNKMAEGDLGKLASDVAKGMKDVGQIDMPKAASKLNQAHETAGNQDPKDSKQDEQARAQAKQTADSAKDAVHQQGEAIAKMKAIIARLDEIGELEAAKADLGEIIEEHRKVMDDTLAISPKTLGQDPSQLSKGEQEQLDNIAKREAELAKRTSDLIHKLEESGDQAKQSNGAGAASMAEAAKVGKENDVPGKLTQASGDVGQNRTSQATGGQGHAMRGLQQMMSALEKTKARQLLTLQRQLAELIDDVRKLKEGEEALHKDTQAAGAKAENAVMAKQGDRQGTLQMNTIVVQKKAANTKETQPASEDIRDAGEWMVEAAAALYGNRHLAPLVPGAGRAVDESAALEPETAAIARLGDAIKKLEELKRNVDNEVKNNDLAEIIKQYEAIRTGEQSINGSSRKIEAARLLSPGREIDRQTLIQVLPKLAGDQGALIGEIAKLSSDERLVEYEVIVWMNGQISEAMGKSKEGLTRAQLGRQVAMAQQTAIDRLTDIIDSLKEEMGKPSKFDPGTSTGPTGPNRNPGKPPLLPTTAQLKLVKAMQKVVNAETVSVNQALETAENHAEKAQLEGEAAKVGQTQGELKGIMEKLVDEMPKGDLK